MKALPAILAALASVGCAANFDRASMEEKLWDGDPLFTDQDVEWVERLKPQLAIPFRLAVAPPIREEYGVPPDPARSHAEIRAWAEPLLKSGVVSEVLVLPRMLLRTPVQGRHTHDYFKAVRVAAARVQADAVLFLTSVTEVEAYTNPLCILDATLVGLLVSPGHHREALTLVEGVLLDNRNEYVYWTGMTEGKGLTVGPLATVDGRTAARESRSDALRAFGALLAQEAPRLRTSGTGK
ncbi:MAG TPA: hypothetical protein VEJ18_09150 [Planctomycetota bacterium]|nr:hypothetical protein [Planctomycetota bacterium]